MKNFNPDRIYSRCIEMEVGEVALINGVPFEAMSVTDGLIELRQTSNAKRKYMVFLQNQFEQEQKEDRAKIIGDINAVISLVGFSCYEIDATEPQEEGDLMEVTAYVGSHYDAASLGETKVELNKKGYWVTFAE